MPNDRIKILWVCDVPGWAYDNRSRNIAKLLPEYAHDFAYTSILGFNVLLKLFEGYDIIINWYVNYIVPSMSHKFLTGLTGGRAQMAALDRILNGFDI